MEAVEAAAQLRELLPFFLENLPDRAAGAFWMTMRLGIGGAFVEEPGVQLLIALESQARGEEAFADKASLVPGLPSARHSNMLRMLEPLAGFARGRRAGHRLDEIMAAHLKEAAIVLPVLAGEDCLPCQWRARSPFKVALGRTTSWGTKT